MSDTQQGSDWWKASDGKWYPPSTSTPAKKSDNTETVVTEPKSRRLWKTWQLVTASLVALLIGAAIGGAGGGGDTDTNLAAQVDQKITTTTTKRTTTTEATSSTTAKEPTTTTAAPTTTAPTTTTVPPMTKDSFKTVFDGQRGEVLTILEKEDNIETVDKFVYDQGAGTVVLDVTSTWSSPDNQANGAWAIARGMAVLWEPGDGVWTSPGFTPNFTLVNSGRRYACPASLMLKLGGSEAARSEFESTCR